jgi:hypothetical protein
MPLVGIDAKTAADPAPDAVRWARRSVDTVDGSVGSNR